MDSPIKISNRSQNLWMKTHFSNRLKILIKCFLYRKTKPEKNLCFTKTHETYQNFWENKQN